MEAVVVPFLINVVELKGLILFLAVCFCTAAEVSYWYWFAGWLYLWLRETSETLQGAIQFGKEEVIPKAEQASIPATIHLWVKHHIIDRFNPDTHRKKRIFKALKGLGYISGCAALFGIGIAPGFWITGLILCRSIRWKVGFIFLIMGNIVKNYGLGSLIGEFWGLVI